MSEVWWLWSILNTIAFLLEMISTVCTLMLLHVLQQLFLFRKSTRNDHEHHPRQCTEQPRHLYARSVDQGHKQRAVCELCNLGHLVCSVFRFWPMLQIPQVGKNEPHTDHCGVAHDHSSLVTKPQIITSRSFTIKIFKKLLSVWTCEPKEWRPRCRIQLHFSSIRINEATLKSWTVLRAPLQRLCKSSWCCHKFHTLYFIMYSFVVVVMLHQEMHVHKDN